MSFAGMKKIGLGIWFKKRTISRQSKVLHVVTSIDHQQQPHSIQYIHTKCQGYLRHYQTELCTHLHLVTALPLLYLSLAYIYRNPVSCDHHRMLMDKVFHLHRRTNDIRWDKVDCPLQPDKMRSGAK